MQYGCILKCIKSFATPNMEFLNFQGYDGNGLPDIETHKTRPQPLHYTRIEAHFTPLSVIRFSVSNNKVAGLKQYINSRHYIVCLLPLEAGGNLFSFPITYSESKKHSTIHEPATKRYLKKTGNCIFSAI